ncbi:MAG: ATP-binding cassette domain-containing protein [Myxococcales bacterium]|nr:ATP-binding cassette domain-containing protein [Myxococcales bacterium]
MQRERLVRGEDLQELALVFEYLVKHHDVDVQPSSVRGVLQETLSLRSGGGELTWWDFCLLAGDALHVKMTRFVGSARTLAEIETDAFPIFTRLDREDGAWLGILARERGSFLVTHFLNQEPSQWLTVAELRKELGVSEDTAVPWIMSENAIPLEKWVESFPKLAEDGHVLKSALGRLRALIRSERESLWAVTIYAALIGLLTLATPIAVQALVNTVAFGTLLQPLIVLTILLAAGLGFSAFLQIMQTYMVELISRRIFVRVVADFSYRLPRIEQEARDEEDMREAINRFFDVAALQKTLSMMLFDGFSSVLQISVAFVLLALYHPILLAFSIVLVVAIMFVTFTLGRGAIETSIKESKAKYAIAAWLEDIADNPQVFRSSGGMSLAQEHADSLAKNYLMIRIKHFRIVLRQLISNMVLQVLTSTGLLLVGGWLVIQRQLTLGQLVAAELVITALVLSLGKMGKLYEKFYDMMASLDKLGHIVDLPVELPQGHPLPLRTAPVNMHLHEVGYSYGYNALLEHVELEIPQSSRLALMGAPGSGKSTLLDIMYGARIPTTGQIALDQIDYRDIRQDDLRRDLVLLREIEIFNDTVFENIRAGRNDIGRMEAREALAKVGLRDSILCTASGLNSELLSGGAPLSQQQRIQLMLARAIAARPRLLLIDGLLDQLDPRSRSPLLATLFAPDAPWTLVLVTHRVDLLRLCTHTYDIENKLLTQTTLAA